MPPHGTSPGGATLARDLPDHPLTRRNRHAWLRPLPRAGDSLRTRADNHRAGPDLADSDRRTTCLLTTARQARLNHGHRDDSQYKTRSNARQQPPVMHPLP